ncbi:class I cytokine receptor like factor 3 [Ciona intestinalis]
MYEGVQEAIETVDSARQHKCELESREKHLKTAVCQVRATAEYSRKEIENHFESMNKEIACKIDLRKKLLLHEVTLIENTALIPLNECQNFLQERISEAGALVSTGENILQCDYDNTSGKINFDSFISMAENLSLDSVPEVPLLSDVPSISFVFNEDFSSEICQALEHYGTVSKRSPVQISDLKPIPGGVVVTWSDNNLGGNENSHRIYKLQFCHGRVNLPLQLKNTNETNFKDSYVGPDLMYSVKNLCSNSIYTFRVCQCSVMVNSDTIKQCSPWSVCQEKMTTMDPFLWSNSSDSVSYTLSDKGRSAIKKNSLDKVLYSARSSHIIGYSINFKIDTEGKSYHTNDCLALTVRRDADACSLHMKSGTLCLMADGHVWVNGTKSATRFSRFCRGSVVAFDVGHIPSTEFGSIGNKIKQLRVSITVGEHCAVFDWHPVKSATQLHSQDFAFAMLFHTSGWKVSIT